MPETVSWSISVGASSGAGLASHGALGAEAATFAKVDLDAAMPAATDLALQIADTGGIVFFAVSASRNDGSVTVQGDGAAPTPLTGPLILFGEAVGLFAGDLTALKAQNTHATEAATLTILIGRALSV